MIRVRGRENHSRGVLVLPLERDVEGVALPDVVCLK